METGQLVTLVVTVLVGLLQAAVMLYLKAQQKHAQAVQAENGRRHDLAWTQICEVREKIERLPQTYVMREDYLRAIVSFEDRLDQLDERQDQRFRRLSAKLDGLVQDGCSFARVRRSQEETGQ